MNDPCVLLLFFVLSSCLDLECNCSMGLFPEISRAWLTIDSIVYIWNYEDGCDLAYFDGLNQVLLCVGLVTPKEGVFQPHIQYLLVLATAVEVVLLGVCFTGEREGDQGEGEGGGGGTSWRASDTSEALSYVCKWK